jgi:dinuclear metal center YbgI/SA1388 family protein
MPARRPSTATDASAADLSSALDAIAPFSLAAEWDNVGLLAGRPDWPVRRALLTIDLSDAVARECLVRRAGAVVAYHPPIFRGIRSVGPRAEAPTTLLADLLAARVSILAVHTALDAAVGGTNDVLLDALEIEERRPLEPLIDRQAGCKLVVFVPPDQVGKLRSALSAAGAGVIGHYRECSFELLGRGSFLGDETTRPSVGRRGVLEYVEEVRLEMVVPAARLAAVVRALYATHPYEEPAFDLYPVHTLAGRGAVGQGRVGMLQRPLEGRAIVRKLAPHVDLSAATVVGDLRRRFASVTAAAGSFGIGALRDPESLVITGELRHHDALQLLVRGVTAVCLGHYASERPALERLRRRLAEMLPRVQWLISQADAAPLRPLSAESGGGR